MARKGTAATGISFGSEVDGFSSGYGVIDVVSGVPGVLFPRATLVEVFGLKSSSKTTLILETIAYNQMKNPNFRVLYADFEKMLRKQAPYLKQLGVELNDNFVCITPDTMEDGCAEILKYVREDNFDMVVVDTVAAMRPRVEIEKGFGENKQMGVRGKIMSEFLRNLMADLPEDGPAIVFINQMYKDIQNSSFVQQYVTPSSDSLAFYAGIRIEVRESTKLKKKIVNPYTLEEEELPIGSIISIATKKNKVGKPFLKSKYVVTYGFGIDIIPSMVTAAQKTGAIQTKGNSKSSFLVPLNGEEKSVVGMNRLLEFFEKNPQSVVEVGSKINPLWAKDLSDYVERISRKTRQEDGYFSDIHYESSEEDGESLDLGEGPSTGEGGVSFSSSDFDGDEATSEDVSKAFSATVTSLKIKEQSKPEQPTPVGGFSQFKV